MSSYRDETDATRSENPDSGPDTSIHIESVDGDIDLHITIGEDGEVRTDESDDGRPSDNEEAEQESVRP